MTCSSCSGAVESTLAGLPGVAHAAVSLTLQASRRRLLCCTACRTAGGIAAQVACTPAGSLCSLLPWAGLTRSGLCAYPAGGQSRVRYQPAGRGAVLAASCCAAVGLRSPAASQTRYLGASQTLPRPLLQTHPSQAQLVAAVEECGFTCSPLGSGEAATLLLAVGGMACASCSSAAEAALRGTEGVLEASVSLLTGKAEVRPGGRQASESGCWLVCLGGAPELPQAAPGRAATQTAAAWRSGSRQQPMHVAARVLLPPPGGVQVRYNPDRVGPRQLIQVSAGGWWGCGGVGCHAGTRGVLPSMRTASHDLSSTRAGSRPPFSSSRAGRPTLLHRFLADPSPAQVIRDAGYEAQPLSDDRHADGSALRQKETRVGALAAAWAGRGSGCTGWAELALTAGRSAARQGGLLPQHADHSCWPANCCASRRRSPCSFGAASSCGRWPSPCRSSSFPWSSCEGPPGSGGIGLMAISCICLAATAASAVSCGCPGSGPSGRAAEPGLPAPPRLRLLAPPDAPCALQQPAQLLFLFSGRQVHPRAQADH